MCVCMICKYGGSTIDKKVKCEGRKDVWTGSVDDVFEGWMDSKESCEGRKDRGGMDGAMYVKEGRIEGGWDVYVE